MAKSEDGFLSEDGQTYTSFVENDDDDSDNDDLQVDNQLDASDQIGSLISQIKIDELPDAQRGVFSKLIETVKGLSTELNEAKKGSDNNTILRQLIEKLGQPQIKVDDKDDKNKRDKLVDKLQFDDPEKDYYAPHLKLLASAIDELIDGIKGIETNVNKRFDESQKNSFVKDVKSFVVANKIPEKVIKKMDEIAKSFGPGAYNDLERLHKLAKAELGIREAPVTQQKKENVFQFSNRSKRDSNVEVKPAKTMLEAWNQALDSLAESE